MHSPFAIGVQKTQKAYSRFAMCRSDIAGAEYLCFRLGGIYQLVFLKHIRDGSAKNSIIFTMKNSFQLYQKGIKDLESAIGYFERACAINESQYAAIGEAIGLLFTRN